MFPLPALNSFSGVSYPAVADFESISTIIYQDWGWRGGGEGYFSFLYRPWLNWNSMNEGGVWKVIYGHLLIAIALPYFCGRKLEIPKRLGSKFLFKTHAESTVRCAPFPLIAAPYPENPTTIVKMFIFHKKY